MPRAKRLLFEGAFYHVYNRGSHRFRIFWTDADYRQFEAFLFETAHRCNIHLYDWHLMPNHFHLLLETPDANLTAFMQRLLSRYAQYFNRSHRHRGHVFQGRYGAKLCDREAYLLELVRYITLQAHRAKNAATLLRNGEWPWSAHRFYLHGNEPEVARPYIHAVLRRFSDDLAMARERYARFIAEGLKNPERILKIPSAQKHLGDERFIQESKQKARQPSRQSGRLPPVSLERLVQAVWEGLGVTAHQLTSPSKNRQIAAARRVFAFAARKYWRYPGKAVASVLNKEPSAISQMVRLQETTKDKTSLEQLIKALDPARSASG